MQVKLEQTALEHEHYRIPLTHGLEAIVSPRDYGKLMLYKWKAKKSAGCWYAVRTLVRAGTERTIRMHREITSCPPGLIPHHINKNTLDNRRENLLVCTEFVHKGIHKWS